MWEIKISISIIDIRYAVHMQGLGTIKGIKHLAERKNSPTLSLKYVCGRETVLRDRVGISQTGGSL